MSFSREQTAKNSCSLTTLTVQLSGDPSSGQENVTSNSAILRKLTVQPVQPLASQEELISASSNPLAAQNDPSMPNDFSLASAISLGSSCPISDQLIVPRSIAQKSSSTISSTRALAIVI